MKNCSKTGFTLIELLVAIGIFGILITIITGVFTRFMIIERHGIAEGQLISDLRSGLESFVKEARTGYGSTYRVAPTGKEVVFRNQAKDCISYRVNSTGVFERASIGRSANCDPGAFLSAAFSPLTGSKTNIEKINFNVIIAQQSGSKLTSQGMITISIRAASHASDIAPIELENTVVSRQLVPYF